MKKLVLLFITLLFCVSTFAVFTTQADGDRRAKECVRRCREQYEQTKERCRELPRQERRECLRRAEEQLESCVRGCRD